VLKELALSRSKSHLRDSGAPVIGRYSVSAISADADNQPIFIPFHRRARRTSAAGAEWMGKCFSVVRCQNSGTVRAGPNRTLEFP